VSCALAAITDHRNNVVAPTLSNLNADEVAFLAGHVSRLRKHMTNPNSRGR